MLCKQAEGGRGWRLVRGWALVCMLLGCSDGGRALPAEAEGAGAQVAPDGEHYGVYRAGRFELHDRAGALLAALPASEHGFRHKLIGAGRVLAPVVQPRGPDEGRMIAVQLRDVRGALLAEIVAPDGVRFTRASEQAITLATAQRVARHALDGRQLWSRAIAAHDLAVAAHGDRVAVVSADDTRHVTLLDSGRVIAAADLREPVWNLALSASGEHVALTTRHSLHAFARGRLQLNQALPLRHAVSLALADDGRMLVGGQDAEGRARVLCYAPDGRLLAERAYKPEQHAFRPAVRWLDAERWQARLSGATHEDGCPRSAGTAVPTREVAR